MRRAAMLATFLRPRELLSELLDAGLDVRLQVLGTLVLRNRPQHLSEALQPLLRLACLAKGFFCLLVLGCDVRGHS